MMSKKLKPVGENQPKMGTKSKACSHKKAVETASMPSNVGVCLRGCARAGIKDMEVGATLG